MKIRIDINPSQMNLLVRGGSVVERIQSLNFMAALLEKGTETPQEEIDFFIKTNVKPDSTLNDQVDTSFIREKIVLPNQKEIRPTVGRKPPAGSSKIFQGKPVFKCAYACPECERKGTRFIWSGCYFVKCHGCSFPIHVKNAVSGVEMDFNRVPLLTDAAGNYYVASERFLPRTEREADKELLKMWEEMETCNK